MAELGQRTMSYNELALRTGLSLRTLKRLVKQKRLPHIRYTANSVRFDRERIDAWIQAHAVEAISPPAESR